MVLRVLLLPLDYFLVKFVLDYQLKKVSNQTSVYSTRKKVYDTFWWIITYGWIFSSRKVRDNIIDGIKYWWFGSVSMLGGTI